MKPPDCGLPAPLTVGQTAKDHHGLACVVVVKHSMPDGTDILGWELVSDLGSLR
jgi:hypothetical protein